MPSRIYYNEIDPYAVRWLHRLMVEGVIAPGDVDTRSIEDITPNDLAGYDQCHFFAGIGVWSYALRLAGWPDDRPVWTGSCPCQPFSQAGKGDGFDDERHLWPAFYHLIGERRPPVVFGEQVASKDGLAWLDLVQADLEGAGYAVGPQDTCAAGVGAPHIRQRLYWVADRDSQRFTQRREPDVSASQSEQSAPRRANTGGRSQDGIVGNADDGGSGRNADDGGSGRNAGAVPGAKEAFRRSMRRFANRSESSGSIGELGNNNNQGLPLGPLSADGGRVIRVEGSTLSAAEPVRGFWSGADWIACRDGKWRPVEPGAFPLASGVANRVGRLRAYGTSLCAAQAKEFIGAYLDVQQTDVN